MRSRGIVTWILILSIVDFALAAPVAVRERLVLPVDVDVLVVEGGAATSQKRYDPLDDWSTSNAADQPPASQSLNPSELDGLWEDVAEQRIARYSPPTSQSPRSSSESSMDLDWPPPNPGSPTGPQGGSPLPPLPRPGGPGPSEVSSPDPPDWSEDPNTLSSTRGQPPPLQSPSRYPVTRPLPSPQGPQPMLDEFWNALLESSGSRLPHPGTSEGGSVNPETLTSTGSQPPLLSPPQNPGQEVTRPPRPGPLPVLDEYWNALSKGSGSSQLHPGPSEGSLPSPPGGSVNPDTLPSTGSQPPSPSPPQGPAQEVTRTSSPGPLLDEYWNALLKGGGSPQLHPGPSEDRFPSPPGGSVNPDTLPSTGSQPPSLSPPQTRPPRPGPLPVLDEYRDVLSKGSGSPQLHPGPSEDRFPSPSGGSVNPDTSSTGGQPPVPQSPARDPVTRPPPSPEVLPDEFWDSVLKSSGSPPPPLHPGPSEDRFPNPPSGPVDPNALSSTGGPPPPPKSPERIVRIPVTRPPPNSSAGKLWDALFKGKYKRHISGPVL